MTILFSRVSTAGGFSTTFEQSIHGGVLFVRELHGRQIYDKIQGLSTDPTIPTVKAHQVGDQGVGFSRESSMGYMSRCQIYTGKEGGRQDHGLSHRVVMDLVRYLSGSHATIFIDNFYTSVKLLRKTYWLYGFSDVAP